MYWGKGGKKTLKGKGQNGFPISKKTWSETMEGGKQKVFKSTDRVALG